MQRVQEALELLKPRHPRATLQYWESCKLWAVYIFDGGRQIAKGEGATLGDACAAILADAKRGGSAFDPTEAPRAAERTDAAPARRRSLSDLLD